MLRYKLQDFSKLPDCSGLSENGRCIRLNIVNCQGENCSFKRTCEEDTNSMKYVNKRLSSLDIFTQNLIAEKYFGGFMPWNGEKSDRTHKQSKR